MAAGKDSTCNAGDLGSIPGLGRSRGEGKRYSLQCPGLENSKDHIVHGVAELYSTEQLSLSLILGGGKTSETEPSAVSSGYSTLFKPRKPTAPKALVAPSNQRCA